MISSASPATFRTPGTAAQASHSSSGRQCWFSRSVVSDSCGPRGLYPSRLLCPWDSPGKNTGLGCHFLLQGICLTQGSNPHLLCCRGSPALQVGFFTN